jgi:hypothetical protein
MKSRRAWLETTTRLHELLVMTGARWFCKPEDGFQYPTVHQFIPDRLTARRPAVNRSIQVRVLVGEAILFEIKILFSFYLFLPTSIPTTGIGQILIVLPACRTIYVP